MIKPTTDTQTGNTAQQAAENAWGTATALSPRECQVAELVTQGLSDREISSRLVISQRTVESHVAHILNKLGFSSRVQVATYVTRRFHQLT
ncbi:response regulator transcription factor [Streptomyces polygonati]|uniref:Response regulator transcription factor n=1 Tax=Streptomyces polygonati TaxID=1617087 RepID=A0ABV8HL17_9ACTN